VAGKVTAGLAESNGSLPLGSHLWADLPVHRDQLRTQRSVPSMGSLYLFTYCGQTTGWMKTPLGVEVDLGPGHIALDGTQLPSVKGHSSPPSFQPCLLWPRSPISATAELLFLFFCDAFAF